MRVVVIAQEDPFTIPRNVERLLALRGVEVALVVVVDAAGALVRRKRRMARGFGVVQSARMARALAFARLLDGVDRTSGTRFLARRRSLRAVADRHEVDYVKIRDPNAPSFVTRLEQLKVDLIVSYSAPCRFRRPLLEAARHGCINLHCSLLPAYAGLLPSFWVLYHEEKETGATVHRMSEEIDRGEILGQVDVPIETGTSMFQLIGATKDAGGRLAAGIVEAWAHSQEESPPSGSESVQAERRAREASYFSWPTVEQMREFRRRGGRLI